MVDWLVLAAAAVGAGRALVTTLGRVNLSNATMGFADGIGSITAVLGDTAAMTRHHGGPGRPARHADVQRPDGRNLVGQPGRGVHEHASPTYRLVEPGGAKGATLTCAGTTNPPVGSRTSVTPPSTQGALRLTNGQVASKAQIRAVPANVQSTNIRTEYFSNGEQIAFDTTRFNRGVSAVAGGWHRPAG